MEEAAVTGYNTCVLAYGQSGTGKSFTIMGNEVRCGFLVAKRIEVDRIVDRLNNCVFHQGVYIRV